MMQLDFREYVNEQLWSRVGAGVGGAFGGLPGAALGSLAGWGADKLLRKPGEQPYPGALHGAAVGGAFGGWPGAALGGLAGLGAEKLFHRQGEYPRHIPYKSTYDFERGEIDPEHIGYFTDNKGQVKTGILPQFRHLYPSRKK